MLARVAFSALIILGAGAPLSAAQPVDRSGTKFTHIAGISVGETVFADVRRRFGAATVVSTGDAGGAMRSLCYWLPAQQIQVTFRSSELGGPKREVTGVDVERAARRARSCAVPPRGQHQILSRLPAGLSLGSTRKDVAVALGIRHFAARGMLSRMYESRQRLHGRPYDLTITVTAAFSPSRRGMVRFTLDRAATV